MSAASFLGSSVVSLKLVEIIPLPYRRRDFLGKPNTSNQFHLSDSTALSSALVKIHLQKSTSSSSMVCSFANATTEPSIRIRWTRKQELTEIQVRHGDNFRHHELRSGFLMTSRHNESEGGYKKVTVGDKLAKKADSGKNAYPIVYLPSADPVDFELRPCWIIGYALQYSNISQQNNDFSSEVMITDSTLVRILPQLKYFPESNKSAFALDFYPFMHDDFVGEISCPILSEDIEKELLNNHNPETIQQLTLLMSLLLSEPVSIGTTSEAIILKQKQRERSVSLQQAIHGYFNQTAIKLRQSKSASTQDNMAQTIKQFPSMVREGALILHSPHHGSGKTLLVQMIARRYLGCKAVHIIQPGPLLAKYGVHADAALESILHAITLTAAAAGASEENASSICIILDHFEAMMPPKLSGRASAGDAAIPVLNAIASYLKMLTLSIRRKKEFPFPSKNQLYNLGGVNGDCFPVRVCLVAIVTCPDDGWRKSSSDSGVGGTTSTILDSLAACRYRLPTLSAKTRLKAFQWSFKAENIALSPDADRRLAVLAASAVWARGSAFRRVGKTLISCVQNSSSSSDTVKKILQQATAEDVESALSHVRSGNMTTEASNVSFLASSNGENGAGSSSEAMDDFALVGGNSDAKKSLEDALALDPTKRAMLSSLGWAPPIGVLLYGPPGCGKTLLAKALARLLRAGSNGGSHDQSALGGAFISLNSSEIVHSTVGTSEKEVVAAFETARMNAPSVVFIDEFQALFTARGGTGSGRLSSTLLQCMDDVKRWRDANYKVAGTSSSSLSSAGETATDVNIFSDMDDSSIVVLAATNTPWMVDKAFLRPGRFDRLVHVGLPTQSERESIFNIHAGRMKIRNGDEPEKYRTLCSRIAKETEGFSGADLAALCRTAAVRCLMEDPCAEYVEERHFVEELNRGMQASSNKSLVQRNLTWRP